MKYYRIFHLRFSGFQMPSLRAVSFLKFFQAPVLCHLSHLWTQALSLCLHSTVRTSIDRTLIRYFTLLENASVLVTCSCHVQNSYLFKLSMNSLRLEPCFIFISYHSGLDIQYIGGDKVPGGHFGSKIKPKRGMYQTSH